MSFSVEITQQKSNLFLIKILKDRNLIFEKSLPLLSNEELKNLVTSSQEIVLSDCIVQNFDIQELITTNKIEANVNFSNCVFIGKVNFSGLEFNKGVDFGGSVFVSEKVDFSNVKFRKAVSFHNVRFYSEEVNFSGAVFNGEVNFRNAIFTGRKSFVNSKFYNDVDFTAVDFSDGDLDFSSSSFHSGRKIFRMSVFGKGKKDFSRVNFGDGDVSFESVEFGDGDVSFRSAIFGVGKKDFRRCKFGTGKKNFSNAYFGEGSVQFVNADFGDGKLLFKMTQFERGNLDFHYSKFGKADIIFDKTIFSVGNVDFRAVDFVQSRIVFNKIEIERGDFDFEAIELWNGVINFKNSYLGYGNFNFKNALCTNASIVIENVDFGEGTVTFYYAQFKEIVLRHSEIKGYFDLRVKSVEKLDLSSTVIKDIVDLQSENGLVKIKSIDFRKVRLLGRIYIDWEELKLKDLILSQDSNWQQKAEQFRMLKENFHSLGMYKEEDLAYIEFKRAESKAILESHRKRGGLTKIAGYINYGLKKLVLDWMGHYATNPIRVLISMLIVYMFFSIIYIILELFSPSPQIISSLYEMDSPQVLPLISRAFYHSAITFLTIGYGDYYPSGVSRLLSGIEGFIGLFMMSYFTVAFVRKILR